MRQYLKKNLFLKSLVITARFLKRERSIPSTLRSLAHYFKDYFAFRRLPQNDIYKLQVADLFPRIYDRSTSHKLDPVYFLQGTWCAKKVFENKPHEHFDIGSQALMVGIISQFAPTTMVDIRPLPIALEGLSFIKGDITSLPFKNDSIDSLSSICVIEHIGLGRYGDPLDPFGTEKAAQELVRTLALKGNLYISVPIDNENKIYFNAHRAFTREYTLDIFKTLQLMEEKYIYGSELVAAYDPKRGFGTGLFHFKK